MRRTEPNGIDMAKFAKSDLHNRLVAHQSRSLVAQSESVSQIGSSWNAVERRSSSSAWTFHFCHANAKRVPAFTRAACTLLFVGADHRHVFVAKEARVSMPKEHRNEMVQVLVEFFKLLICLGS